MLSFGLVLASIPNNTLPQTAIGLGPMGCRNEFFYPPNTSAAMNASRGDDAIVRWQ
jgi:hypothetical protein